LFDPPALIVGALLKFNNSLFNVGDDVNNGQHSELAIPHALNVAGLRVTEMHLPFHNVEPEFGPMAVPARNKLLRNSSELLEKNSILLHQDGDCAEPDHILKGIETAIRCESVLVRVLRRKEILTIPRSELPLGQPRQARDMIFAEDM
jgi:hypothetical protein